MLNRINFKSLYSSGESDSPISFFTDALSNSMSFDLGLGFFSSASFNVLSIGFAKFISHGGTMRLYINQYLSEEDYAIFTTHPEIVEDKVIDSFASMLTILTKRDKHFFNCLSYLIYTHRIEVRIVIPNSGGIAHQKFGIFTDEVNNKVSFIGSLNLTASALLSKNIESISCNASWKGAAEMINDYQLLFNKYFSGDKEGITVIPANRLTKEIIKAFPATEEKTLLDNEKELIEELKKQKFQETNSIKDVSINEPHFPYPTGAFDYQKDAYKNWENNGYTGIFAMATGTGKTITSLNCALEEYRKTGKYRILILVPSNDLVSQWVGEVQKFNYQNVFVVNGRTNWKKELTELKNDFGWGIERNFVIISTYASFVDPSFQGLIKKLYDNNMILIADEAHNVGSPSVRLAFDVLPIMKRIALSATPKRVYDEEGTAAVEEYFHDKEPYCYSFSMERAIKEGRLMHYLYYPRIAYLNEVEMKRYISYTKQLLIHFDPKSKKFDDSQEVKELLMKRKRIIHKAKDKYRVFMTIIDDLVKMDKTKYCFVYTPEGVDYTSGGGEQILTKMKDLVYESYPEIRTNTFLGGDGGKRDKLKAFAEGEIDMLFAMKCLDEGVDVPRAEVGIFASSTGNPRQFIQRRGRLLRVHPDKTFAYIYDIIVVPDYGMYPDDSVYEMERSQVKQEIMRVAYFASLSDNYYDTTNALQDLLNYYNIELSSLISELQIQ